MGLLTLLLAGAGWNVHDFVLEPQNFLVRADSATCTSICLWFQVNKEVLWDSIRAVRHLWQGGKLEMEDGSGKIRLIQTWPRPVQQQLEVATCMLLETLTLRCRYG